MITLRDLRAFAKYHLVRRVYDYPAAETELGVELLGFDRDAYRAELERPRDGWLIETLDELWYRGARHPVHLVSSAGEGRRTLLVLAGVHGNEHAGVLAIPALLDRLQPADLGDVRLRIVTPVNPVGAAEGSRYNAGGFDVNRDFVRFETAEARLVRRVFDDAPPCFVVSLHEGPQDGAFLFANRLVAPELAGRVLGVMQARGCRLAAKDYFGRRLEPSGYAPTSNAMYALNVLWARTLGMMASGMWAETRGVPEITLESSWRCPDRATRVEAHLALLEAVVAELSS